MKPTNQEELQTRVITFIYKQEQPLVSQRNQRPCCAREKTLAERLTLVVPLTLLLIFILLYCAFRNITEPAIVMLTIPFSLIGGIWLVYWLWVQSVGFIALAGTRSTFRDDPVTIYI